MPCEGTAACLEEAKAALETAEAALDDLKADDEATQGAVKTAEAAVEAAEMALETAQTAHTEYLAMQPPTYDSKALQTAIGTVGAVPDGFTPDAGKITADDTELALSSQEAPLINDWQGAVYKSATDTVVSYTNVKDPTDQAYSVYYAESDQPGVTGTANDGVLTLSINAVSANHELFDAAALPVGGNTYEDYANDPDTDVDERMFEGSFNGIPGTFACTDATCRAENDADGDLAKLTGAWMFTPDEAPDGSPHMISGVVEDDDYIDFGYWVKTTPGDDGPIYAVNTFVVGSNFDSVARVEGEASYTGGAAGLFTRRPLSPGGDADPDLSGRFTANANLKAYFTGGDVAANKEFTLDGTVDRFMHNGELIDPIWRVTLKAGAFGSGAFTNGTANGVADSFSGTFYGDNTDETALPTGIGGEFDAAYDNGEVIGAFGATLVPATK